MSKQAQLGIELMPETDLERVVAGGGNGCPVVDPRKALIGPHEVDSASRRRSRRLRQWLIKLQLAQQVIAAGAGISDLQDGSPGKLVLHAEIPLLGDWGNERCSGGGDAQREHCGRRCSSSWIGDQRSIDADARIGQWVRETVLFNDTNQRAVVINTITAADGRSTVAEGVPSEAHARTEIFLGITLHTLAKRRIVSGENACRANQAIVAVPNHFPARISLQRAVRGIEFRSCHRVEQAGQECYQQILFIDGIREPRVTNSEGQREMRSYLPCILRVPLQGRHVNMHGNIGLIFGIRRGASQQEIGKSDSRESPVKIVTSRRVAASGVLVLMLASI